MKKILVAGLLIMGTQGIASSIHKCFPESNLKIEVSDGSEKLFFQKKIGLDKSEYIETLKLFENTWSRHIEKKYNKKLIVKDAWEESRVNAHATRDDDNNPVIVFNGGLARHEEMNKDAMLLILCHELGHHYGGAPKSFRGRSTKRSWSSAEGQADYFATNKCINKFFLENLGFRFENDSVSESCETEVCERVSSAALKVGNLFASLKRQWRLPTLNKKDKNKVDETNYSHPRPQCRVDTFIAGNLCKSEYEVDFDNEDYRVGACLREDFPAGARPSCWFSSQTY